VVAVAGDPGGAAAVAPVIERLRQEGHSIEVLAYHQAVGLWRERGLAPVDLALVTDRAEVEHRLGAADALLVGTSFNEIGWEKHFVAASRHQMVPSLAVLDFWSNYRSRFVDDRGNLTFLPDLIAVMDEQARSEMIAEGFPADHLCVTGQPAFDELETFRTNREARRQSARDYLEVGPSDQLIVFVSQPLAALFGTDTTNPLFLGYTEAQVRLALRQALETIARRTGIRILLLIRPHPRENLNELSEPSSAWVHVRVDNWGDRRDVVLAADLVVGMNSVLLVEACLLRCPVLSLQPGLLRPDTLPTNRYGASCAVYRIEDIYLVVEKLLTVPEARATAAGESSRLCVEPNATGRVVDALKALLPRLVPRCKE
jgi:hypothetical protein